MMLYLKVSPMLPAPGSWLVAFVLLDVFFQMSERVLARWLLDVSFQVICFVYEPDADAMILVPEAVIGQAWCLHFGTRRNDFGSLGAPWEAKSGVEIGKWEVESGKWEMGSWMWEVVGCGKLQMRSGV